MTVAPPSPQDAPTFELGPTLPPPRLDPASADAVRASVLGAWRRTDALFDAIVAESSLYAQPDPLRNPLIFYLGHPAAFYVNKLQLAGVVDAGLVPRWERLFERGVDPASADELDTDAAWPEVAEVRAYRARALALVLDAIDALPWGRRVGPDDPHWALLMALEHDRIHFETSSVLVRQLPVDAVSRPEGWRYADTAGTAADVDASAIVRVPAGRVTLGRGSEDTADTFGWDNEFGRLEVDVAAFDARRDLVTNAELRAFVAAGGYDRRPLWTAEGWAWRSEVGEGHPRFWIPDASAPAGFRYRAMFDELPLPLTWPAEVNGHEAAAYARWISGATGAAWRLPTEAEHARLAEGAPERGGDVVASPAYNLCLRVGSPTPIGGSAATSRWGCRDVRGNVWQWLADDFRPLPGFRAHRYYEDFSSPYFGADHGMMAGGSWASSGGTASRWYRLWFRRCFFQHAGFRLVRAAS